MTTVQLIPFSTYHHHQDASLPLLSSHEEQDDAQNPPQAPGQQDRNRRAFLQSYFLSGYALGLLLEVCALVSSFASSKPTVSFFRKATSHGNVIVLGSILISYLLQLVHHHLSGQEIQWALCQRVVGFTTGLTIGYAVVLMASVFLDIIPPVLYTQILVADGFLVCESVFWIGKHFLVESAKSIARTSSSNNEEDYGLGFDNDNEKLV
jgi:hypothetical protein